MVYRLFHGAHWSLGRPTIFQLGIYGCYLRCFNIIQSNDKIKSRLQTNFKNVFIKLPSCPISCQTFLNAREQNDYDTNIQQRERGPIIFYK